MARLRLKSTYAEPTVIWRLQHPDNRRAYSLLIPHASTATAGWFSQGVLQEARDFETWHDALRWLEDKAARLRWHGWQVEDPFDS